jgi:L-fucose mutarotase
MLKNIDPLLGPELLATLRAMGHGEELAIVDRNYPALSAGPKLIRHDGSDGPSTLNAVLSVLPLDSGPQAVTRMHPRDRPDDILPVMADLLRTVATHAPDADVTSLSSGDFKLRAAHAVAIVVTGESRTYGNILVRKGTLGATR